MKTPVRSYSFFVGLAQVLGRFTTYPALAFLLVFLLMPPNGLADIKGHSAVTHGGESLYLFKDCAALVVGVSRYERWPSLPNAVKDARDVSWLLNRLGFAVTLMTDPTSVELKKALDDLVEKTSQEPDRAIIFYYAGNGETQTLPDGTKLGWIIPRDCPLLRDDPKRFERHAISTKALETLSKQMQSKHVLMLFDTSFSGGVFSLEQPVLKVITKNTSMPVRQYIIAGSEDEPIPARSAFKESLMRGLRGEGDLIHDGYITGSELGVYIVGRVTQKTRGRQHPQYAKIKDSTLSNGDFVFILAGRKLEISRLFVETDPADARTRILNIQPRFSQGMELDSGKYHVEVSAPGYDTKSQWITLEPGEDKTIAVRLSKIEESLPAPKPVFAANSLGMKFFPISPGSFVMGSSDSGLDDEKEHRVTLTKPFYLQTTEVTGGQFRQFVKDTGYQTEAEKTGGCWVSAKGGTWKKKRESTWNNPGFGEAAASPTIDDCPVTCVTWSDAQAFIQWLSRKEGKNYGLPTEAEWEYACRAGTTTAFSYGPCMSTDQANYGGLGSFFSNCQGVYRVDRTRPIKVKSLEPNPWGLYDMHGNVSEWCQDWYGPYPEGNVTDPQGPTSGNERVMRGGHWLAKAHGCRSAKRWRFPPNMASDAVGFRLVMRPK